MGIAFKSVEFNAFREESLDDFGLVCPMRKE
jgi:hypothetical protein